MKLSAKSPSAAAIVAGAAFLASAGHIVSVVKETNHLLFALAYPIGIDGLIYVGIRSMQRGQYGRGAVALLIGAIYSLAFNAHAENALTMPKLMIASAMPVAMFAAFIIEHSGAKAEEIEQAPAAPQIITQTVEVEKIVTVLPDLLPIVPLAPKPVAKPKPVRAIETKKDETRTDAPKPVGAGRVAAWDVEKAVRLLADGRTDVEILSLVDGLTAKPWQRTKRAAKLIASDQTDAQIATTCGVSVAHVARIRKA